MEAKQEKVPFFRRLGQGIKNFFHKIGNAISNFFYKLRQTKFMQKLGEILSYLPNKIAKHIPYRKRKAIWGIIFLIPLTIGFIYFFLIPFVQMFIYSFSFVTIGDAGLEQWGVGFKNYIYIFTEDPNFTENFSKAVLSMLTDIPTILIFSLLMAVILNSKFKGRALVRSIFFVPVIFNSQAVTAAISSTSGSLNAAASASTNDLFAQMFNFSTFLQNAGIPYFLVSFIGSVSTKIYDIISYSGIQIIIFLTAIQGVPVHLYEAAKMEGATQYDMFWKITFPMVSPMMLTCAVYTVVDAFLRSPILTSIQAWYAKGTGTYGSKTLGTLSNYGINAAMSVVFCLMSVLIVAIVLGILSRLVFYYDD
ncbi:MAG: sugar ABC transporter permease [Bacilli bacterium]|nr:sugar ABC transporter permease [Bacilli bacterium]